MQNYISKLQSWIDQYGMLSVAAVLLVFIPLYPKLPLFELIEGYIVRARIEDVLIGLAGIFWLVQLKRKKTTVHTPFLLLVLLYAAVGLASTASAAVITQTIPFELIHVGKSLLHYLRYLEYFFLAFITFSAVNSKRDIKILLSVVLITLMAVILYGVGQKYFYWPVYSTMNREFSKGIRLYLTEHARVQSTFGGHYDMAGYLVMLIPLSLSLLSIKLKRFAKFGVAALFVAANWLLIASGSRSSFASYGVALGVLLLLLASQQDTFKAKLSWFGRYSLFSFLTALLLLLFFGQDMSERFGQTLAGFPEIEKQYQLVINQSNQLLAQVQLTDLSLLSRGDAPSNGLSTDEAAVLVASDERPIPVRPDREDPDKPLDVYVDVPDYKRVATISADGTQTTVLIATERVFSENAIQHGLSLGIRLDALWPQAIRGFLNNPALGNGYATLNRESPTQFTEAESTDNNFLRTFGELGILGFIAFYAIIGLVVRDAWRLIQTQSVYFKSAFAAGFLALTVGLLVNALYIDVFAASKIAMTYWLIAGILLAVKHKKVLA